MPPRPALVWFRNDLRTADNPALAAAAKSGSPLIALYVFEETRSHRAMGGASRWWLAGSLRALGETLSALGVPLTLRRGDARKILIELATSEDIDTVYWSRRYDKPEAETDNAIETALLGKQIGVETFNASLLNEPWAIERKGGGPIRVFTPYFKASVERGEPRRVVAAPSALSAAPPPKSDRLNDWALEPARPNWARDMATSWTRGEAGAAARLKDFIREALNGYTEQRDRPDIDGTSRLSPSLRFGEISPHQITGALEAAAKNAKLAKDIGKYRAELGWREFSYHLLHHFPDIGRVNFQRRFDAFPWRDDADALARWQRGETGYPIVDAGMRQLWRTGWMHNRVRMVCASFLIKHLLIDWRLGEAWFWDTLVDADPANNTASWQWVAGSGADAAPYFRNPILQGEKFDPEGRYVRNFIPEIAGLPDPLIHRPWEASPLELTAAGIELGKTYPAPMVDHGKARERALAAFQTLKA